MLRTLAQMPATAPTTAERDPVAHVINRLTFGSTPELYAYVHDIGVQAYIEQQLAPETIDDSQADALMALFPLLQESGAALARQDNNRGQVFGQLVGGTLVRAVYSRRQLYERMVQFWGDHLYVFANAGGPTLFFKVDDDRDAIRPNAMTTFRQVLGASAHSPAMLVYLDNVGSRAEAPNENYARELLELHTLGVNGGYTETDVKEVARALTGWSVSRPNDSDQPGQFMFRPRFHDDAAKRVLGVDLPAGRGVEDGEQVLDLLAGHAATAQFIATKLVRRFVADDPPTALVQAVVQTYMQTSGDVRAMLRTIFAADEFWNAPPRFKRPFEYTVGLMRATDFRIAEGQRFFRALIQQLNAMGHVPFAWPAPNGYPDAGAYWMSNLLPRWNTAITLLSSDAFGRPGFSTLNALLQANEAAGDLDSALLFFGRYLYGRALTGEEFTAMRDYAVRSGDGLMTQIMSGLMLMLAAPGFQVF